MKYKRIGISLGGGGGKGAYQIGVLKAIREYGLDKKIVAIAGTSIGALNMVGYCTDLEQTEKLWTGINRREVLTHNRKYRFRNFAVYSRDGMKKMINDNIDMDKLIKLKQPHMYVMATKVKGMEETVFKLNGRTKEEILLILEASSAIPAVFEKTIIDGEAYYDGGLRENVPLSVLVEQEKCDLIFAIPLTPMHEPSEKTFPDTTIINFKSRSYDKIALWNGILGFTGELARKRLLDGYRVGKDMLNYLIDLGVLEKPRKGFRLRRGPKPKPDVLKKYYVVSDIPKYQKIYAESKLPLGTRVGERALRRFYKRKESKIDVE